MKLARVVPLAAALAVLALVAGCGRAGAPTLESGAKPKLAPLPNAVAAKKPDRPYGENWPYPRREGVFQIDPPKPEPVKPKRSFFLDPLL
ncbi:MAG TPA: hypothetical protein VHD15_11900 [Hyphomicrobiales bacterium]|nr:hypothetical protein [Hyphomicrobiales bacterium]